MIELPAQTIFCGDSTGSIHIRWHPGVTPPAQNVARVDNTGVHNDGDNMAFFDGHAKWVSFSSLLDPNAANLQWRGID